MDPCLGLYSWQLFKWKTLLDCPPIVKWLRKKLRKVWCANPNQRSITVRPYCFEEKTKIINWSHANTQYVPVFWVRASGKLSPTQIKSSTSVVFSVKICESPQMIPEERVSSSQQSKPPRNKRPTPDLTRTDDRLARNGNKTQTIFLVEWVPWLLLRLRPDDKGGQRQGDG